jgi:hypothetical protein
MNKVFKQFSGIFLVIIIVLTSNTQMNGQYTRKFVFEEFTNSGCPPCATYNPALHAWISNHSNVLGVAFHVNSPSPNDVMYLYNPTDIHEHSYNYYKVPFEPYARLSGIEAPNAAYPGFPTDTNKLNVILDSSSKNSDYNIKINFTNNHPSGQVDIEIESLADVNGLYLFVYLVEQHHNYTSSGGGNGEKDFYDIMRKMLPDAKGTLLNLKKGEKKNFSFLYTLADGVNQQLSATAIIQHPDSKTVYQVESAFVDASTSVNYQITSSLNITQKNNLINIELHNYNEFLKEIEIYNIMGQKVNNFKLNNNISNYEIYLENSYTFYILNIKTNLSEYSRKIILSTIR